MLSDAKCIDVNSRYRVTSKARILQLTQLHSELIPTPISQQ